MQQDKHQPKEAKKKFSLSNDAEKVIIGIMIILISLIGLINKGVIGQFLTYIAIYLFGAFYALFYLFLIAFGLILAIRKKTVIIKINLYFLGAILLALSLMMAATLGMEGLTIKTLFATYNNQMSLISTSSFKVTNFSSLGTTGGGFFAAFLVSLLNSCITLIGTRVVVIVLLVASIIILCKTPIKKFVGWIKKKKAEKKAKKEEVESEEKLSPLEETNVNAPLVEEEHEQIIEEPKRVNNVSPIKTYEPKRQNENPLVPEEELQPEQSTRSTGKQSNSSPFFDLFSNRGSEQSPVQVQEPTTQSSYSQPVEKPNKPSVSPIATFTPSNESPMEEPNINKPSRSHPFRETPNTVVLKEESEIAPVQQEENKHYMLPGVSFLVNHTDASKTEINNIASMEKAEKINTVFQNFKLRAEVISYTNGPSVTRYNVRTDPGVRVNQLSNLVNEIQVALNGDKSVRIETVVQGKNTSGIEVGNVAPTVVSFRDCFASINNSNADKLVVPLGQDIDSNVITTSIDDLPHLLVAGTTGSGKSVFIHSIIMTLIMRNYPDELRLIMIDPKTVEFTKYQNIPHLYCPIITDPIQAIAALTKLINEMERRFKIMAREQVANIKEYRSRQVKDPTKEVIPNIVVIIDEFADLIMASAKEVEPLIQRLAQKARAAGIYMIIATQRPSVNVITGDIKANIPARIALSVNSFIDSKTIIDEAGAETLIGKGDLLAKIPTLKALMRVQSAYVDGEEISSVTNYLRKMQKPVYNQEFLNLRMEKEEEETSSPSGAGFSSESLHQKNREDPIYATLKDFVMTTGNASTSAIMRNFRLGYGKAASFLDTLEEDGIIRTTTNNRKEVIMRKE